MSEKEAPKLDRSAFSIVSSDEHAAEELTYWHNKTPHERFEALDQTRKLLYGTDPATARLQRILEIAERA